MYTPDEIYIIIGENIHKVRSVKNLSQDELGKRVGLQRTSITNIENGKQKIQIHTLYQVAQVLKVSLFDLLPNIEVSPNIHRFLNEKEILDKRGVQTLDQEEKDAVLKIIGLPQEEERR